jgi:maltooligosyltrehalose trehalohydrolase
MTFGPGVHPLRHGPLLFDDGTVEFRVWAPYAEHVDLVLRDADRDAPPRGASASEAAAGELAAPRRVALTSLPRGWFTARGAVDLHVRYTFSLDGGDPRPDPASLRQPGGVHAPSALVERGDFPWSPEEAGWRPTPLSSAVIYELHVGTFTPEGTFAAARAHLGDLAGVGVTHVEVMPVAAFNGDRGWGYDGVSTYAVHEPYGGPAAFADFVDACHRHGIAVILDVVYNHFGPSGSYHHEFGPYVTEMHRTPWGPAINFDHAGADAVRAFVVDNALMWLSDFHVDGLRLDAVHALHDGAAQHILAELSAAVDRLSEQVGRQLVLIAESDRQDPGTVLPRAAGGDGMTAQWLDDLHHAIHVTITGERDGYYVDYVGLPDVAAAYVRGFVYDGRWSEARERTVGAPLPETVSGRRFVACTQNHDQVGNRARGRRLTVLCEADRVRFAIGLLCLAPTVPMLFMGEEYGESNPFLYFSSHPEPELAEAVRSGRRAEFDAFSAFADVEVPDPQARSTFEASVLDRAAAQTDEGRARLRLWTDVLALRRSLPALATGNRKLVRSLLVRPHEIAVLRDDPAGFAPVIVVANAQATTSSVLLEVAGGWACRWACTDAAYGGDGSTVTLDARDGALQCGLPAWSVAVLTRVRD